MSQHSIQGKVALVAGGAKNFGGLICRALAEKGAKTLAIQADLSIPANNTRVFEEAIKAFGGVDIAINTAGLVIKPCSRRTPPSMPCIPAARQRWSTSPVRHPRSLAHAASA